MGQNTAVGVYGGYLAEAAATQLVTPAASIRDMTNAAWVAVNITPLKNATGIDGVVNSASTLTATGAAATILQTLVAAGTSRTYSCFMRRKTGTGTILIQQGVTTLDVTALINVTTYTLVQLNANVLNSAFGILINTSGDEIEVDCNQFEAGASATTPIVAGGTRNADRLSYTDASLYNSTAGALYAKYSPINNITGAVIVELSDNSSANRNLIFRASGGGSQMTNLVSSGGGTVASYSVSTENALQTFSKGVCAFQVNDFAACINAGTIGSDVAGALPIASTKLSIAGDFTGSAAAYLNGVINQVNVYTTRPTNPQLRVLTSA